MTSLPRPDSPTFGETEEGGDMAKRAKVWSRTVEEAGVRVRVYERTPGALLSREVRIGGRKDRRSMGHRDKKLAIVQARALAKRVAELQLVGFTGSATLGQLASLYRQHRLPIMSPDRRKSVEGMLSLLERHFPRTQVVEELTAHDVDGYIAARRSGALVAPRHRTPERGVSNGTIRNELALLRAMLRWGRQHRVNGRPLLMTDPLEAAPMPRELNPKRPIATQERYEKLLEVADRAERDGRFRCVLVLVRETGRRINAICRLRISDVLLNREAMERTLAAAGLPIAAAEKWPHGAIHWRREDDKKGYDIVAPISRAAREALDTYIRRGARAGDVPLFPGQQDATKPVTKETAGYWLARAETLANLPHLARGGFHPFRRLWASERRHLPAQDVAAAGGWRSLQVMREAYQHADAATMYAVVDRSEPDPKAAESGHISDTLTEESKAAQ